MRDRRSLQQAFDELRFGPRRTLNLRTGLPRAADAAQRAERWLREQQVAGAKEVLVITGRGRHSTDGVPRIREAVGGVLARLTRAGVVASVDEHTAGSFAIALRPFGTARSVARDDADVPLPADPATLRGLGAETLTLLRRLAITSLDSLGVQIVDERLVDEEMQRQFSRLSASGTTGPAISEDALRSAIRDATIRIEDSF